MLAKIQWMLAWYLAMVRIIHNQQPVTASAQCKAGITEIK